MAKKRSYLKTRYWRKQVFDMPIKFYHTDLEICYKGKIIRVGYYAKNSFFWLLSFISPVLGELREEGANPEKSIRLRADEKKIKTILKMVKSKKFKWKIYSALFRNCFHWRNAVLDEVKIKHPRRDWFMLPNSLQK